MIFNFNQINPKMDFANKNEKKEFEIKRFRHNVISILALSVFLTIEQLYYGFFIREWGSINQTIHFITSFIISIYLFVSFYILKKKCLNINLFNKIFEISFGLLGFGIAIGRSILSEGNIFSLPAIYIAVVYGFAMIFYFRPIKSFLIYFSTSIIAIVLLYYYKEDVLSSNFAADIVSNNIIAWIASIINYKRYLRMAIDEKIIKESNEISIEKTKEIERINKELEYNATMDFLTDLYNRRKSDEILENEWERYKRYKRNFSIIILDIDDFKNINDKYGHNVGDKILNEFAGILKENVRKTDKIGRWGGEEFLIVCPESNLEESLIVAEKIRTGICKNKFEVDELITGSFGISTAKGKESIYELVSKADEAMYIAKNKGKNRIEYIKKAIEK